MKEEYVLEKLIGIMYVRSKQENGYVIHFFMTIINNFYP